MNLKIFCEASVDLIDYNKLESINYVVKEYDMRDETLSGFVTLNGNYSNKNNERCDYVQDVPFTVMFKNHNYNIDNVMLDNFNYYEVVNNGIVCSFDLLIDYNMNIDESQIPNVLYNDESDIEINKHEEMKEEITDNLFNENIVDKELHIEEKENNGIYNENVLSQENISNDINDDLDNDINESNIFDDSESDINSDINNDINNDINIEKTIKEKYDKLLDNIFNNRSDLIVDDEEKTSFEVNNSLEETKHNQININESKSVKENKFGFLKFLDSKTTLRVYYPEKESDIDGICKKENINVLDIYNESYNKDFSDKRRIIIEK